ncbi:MAG TPA: hypothetical protein VLY63_27195 [Anaerolineae bacterium]|nr:hypothetical protein [Anaerolineae bacterium]
MEFQATVIMPSKAQHQRGNSDFRGGERSNASAFRMYQKARTRSLGQELLSLLTGRSPSLLDLDAVCRDCTVHGSHYMGLRRVQLRQIRGSEGRCGDFDADFRPLMPHNEGRWLSVAAARQRGVTLPPVDLIQVGDTYFVQDGHHRISVAKARGEETVEAKVTVWDLVGSPPREHPASAGRLAVQPVQ